MEERSIQNMNRNNFKFHPYFTVSSSLFLWILSLKPLLLLLFIIITNIIIIIIVTLPSTSIPGQRHQETMERFAYTPH